MDVETRAVERFLSGPPKTDDALTDHIFLWTMIKAVRGEPRHLEQHRKGDILTDQRVLRCLMKFTPETIAGLAELASVMEYTESDAYALSVVEANGWLH